MLNLAGFFYWAKTWVLTKKEQNLSRVLLSSNKKTHHESKRHIYLYPENG